MFKLSNSSPSLPSALLSFVLLIVSRWHPPLSNLVALKTDKNHQMIQRGRRLSCLSHIDFPALFERSKNIMNKIKKCITGCLLKHNTKLSNVRDTCMMYKVNSVYPAQTCVRFCFSVREGWRYQIEWIFRKTAFNSPPLIFGKSCCNFFYNWYGRIYSRR